MTNEELMKALIYVLCVQVAVSRGELTPNEVQADAEYWARRALTYGTEH